MFFVVEDYNGDINRNGEYEEWEGWELDLANKRVSAVQ
jgi:hypothetical protein